MRFIRYCTKLLFVDHVCECLLVMITPYHALIGAVSYRRFSLGLCLAKELEDPTNNGKRRSPRNHELEEGIIPGIYHKLFPRKSSLALSVYFSASVADPIWVDFDWYSPVLKRCCLSAALKHYPR